MASENKIEDAAARRGKHLPTDPYLEWALRTKFRYLGGVPEWIPLLLELEATTASQFAAMIWPDGDGMKPWVRVPDLYRSQSSHLGQSRFCMAWVNPSLFLPANNDSPVSERLARHVVRFTFGLPLVPLPTRALLSDAGNFGIGGPSPLAPTTLSAAPPQQVVIGMIDDAFAFCHERFRDATGDTRIKYLWMQDVTMGGVELSASAIGAAVKSATHGVLIDETEVYRVTGQDDFSSPEHKLVAQRRAHGTHVMDIAAGDDPATAPYNRPIIAVQLPGRVVRDTSGANLAPYVINAIRYIIDRADALAAQNGTGPLPIVINLSYGLFAGPHDGSSVIESAIDELVRLRAAAAPAAPLCVVLPVGNNFLWRTHADCSIANGKKQDLQWRIVPDDRTPSIMEIWLVNAASAPQSQVKVRITDPNGNASGWINQDDPPYEMTATSPGAPVLCKLTFDGPTVTGTRPRIVIVVAPTGVFDLSDPSEQVAPSGVWNIEVINFGAAVEVAAWIQRDDTPFGWPILGRQSYFDDPQYQRFDPFGRDRETDSGTSYVKRFGTLNSIATGTTPVVIAGFRRSDRTPAKYSAAGPILAPAKGVAGGRPGWDPNAMAISDDSVVCEGVLAAGTRSNAVFAMNGTSVAAPQITRWIAGKMLAGTKQPAEEVKALALTEEAQHPGARPSPDRGGAGRIEDQLPPPRVPRWEP